MRPELRQFFTELTVFQGSFGSPDVEAVLSQPLALDYLAELCDTSFLTTQVGEFTVRFAMLESLRLFGDAQWESVEAQEGVRFEHASYFANLAKTAKTYWRTDQEGQWRERLETDLENIRAALYWSEETDDAKRLRIAYQFGSSLGRFWWISVRHREGEEYLSRLLGRKALSTHISPEEYLRLQISLISQLFVSARRHEAKVLCLSALDLADQIGDLVSEAIICANLGSIEMDISGWDSGMHYLSKAISFFEETHDFKRLITIYHNVCINNLARRNINEGKEFAIKELDLSINHGSTLDKVSAIQSCANLFLASGDFTASKNIYRQILPYYISRKNAYDNINILKCVFLSEYLENKSEEILLKTNFLNEFSHISGMRPGLLSARIIEWYQVPNEGGITINSQDQARLKIRQWTLDILGIGDNPVASEITAESYDLIARTLLESL